jgi:uncharacterized protein (DUF58 family)
MAAAVAIMGTWWLVAHNGGSGWVQVLGDVVFGALFIGILGPSVVIARAKVRVISAPMDATAGLPAEISIEATTRLRVRPASPPGPETFVGPVRGKLSTDHRITLLPTHRGVHERLTIDVATASPFGLQWWTREVHLPLPSTLHVAPRCGQPVALPSRVDEQHGETSERSPANVGEPRGVRPYRPGDDRRHVHWPASAHAGELMVREMEGPTSEPITVTVNLPREPDEAERVAEQALGTVVSFLDRGAPVLLETTELTGPVAALVDDRRGAGRRLARAVATADTPADTVGVAVAR